MKTHSFNITPSWVREQLKFHKITQKDISDDLHIDKHVISKLLSGKYKMTKWHQATFFYYFKSLESCG